MDDSNVVKLQLVSIGDGSVLDADMVLEANKNKFESLVLVGRTADGEIQVGGTHSAAESHMLLAWGQQFLVSNLVVR